MVEKSAEIDPRPDAVSNVEMGCVFDELVRKFSEAANEPAGDHFTPREVIRLMVDLLFAPDGEVLTRPGIVRTLCDPARGTGGMLLVAEDYLRQLDPPARLEGYGQEYQSQHGEKAFQKREDGEAVLAMVRGMQDGAAGTDSGATADVGMDVGAGVAVGAAAPCAERPAFEAALTSAARAAGLKLDAPLKKAVLSALAKREETAPPCLHAKGRPEPEPDPELRETENVPLGEDVGEYLARARWRR